MESEKRAKRPRIGMSNREGATERYEKVEYRRNGGEEGHSSYSANAERPYYPRNSYGDGGNRSYGNERPNNYGNRQGGYSNNRQGNYGNNRRNNNYNNTPRYNQDYNRNNEVGEGFQQPYGERERPRYPKQNNRPGGYNNRGYNNRGGYNQNRQQPRRNNKVFSRPQRIEYELPEVDPNEPIRLNKFLANAGVCSRREADEFITAGVVSVNGEVVTELGTKIKRSDVVKFHDEPVSIERKVYVLLNKPKDTVTTSDDPQERRTVMDLVKGACNERIYPVGRLDRNTTGVLLLTNDGDLASKLTHPKFLKKKIYHVHLDKNLTKADMEQIAAGIQLDDGEIHADAISYTDDFKKDDVGIEIHSGKNRIVRRIFESLGYKVMKLDRVYFAGLTKKGLRRGEWRYLTEQEVNFLRMGSFE